MGFFDILSGAGNNLMISMLEKGLEASPEKITEYSKEQLEWLIKEGKRKTRDLASEELRKRK